MNADVTTPSETAAAEPAAPRAKNTRTLIGKVVAARPSPPKLQAGLKWIPEWGDFSLSQLTPDGFTLRFPRPDAADADRKPPE